MKYKIEQGCPLLDYEISLDVDKEFYGCCYHGWHKFKNISDLRDWQQEQKQTFLRGEWPEACSVCKKREESVNFSLRIDSLDNEKYRAVEYDPLTAVPHVKFLQLAYKNLCNYSCIMCGPSASTNIIDDVDILKRAHKRAPAHWDTAFIQNNNSKKLVSNKRDVFDQILDVASDIKRVSFMGGEPFLIKEYLDLIKLLKNDCYVHINTNGSVFNRDFINELKRFNVDRVTIGYSIDGVGIINDALRLNSNWKNIENNIQKIKEALPKSALGIAPTWSNLNIYYWKDLYDWAIEHGLLRNDNFSGFWQNCIEIPQELRLNNLTDEWKERIISDMESQGVPTYKVQFYEPKRDTDQQLIDKLDILYDVAKSKGFDYAELFPHVYQYKKDSQ